MSLTHTISPTPSFSLHAAASSPTAKMNFFRKLGKKRSDSQPDKQSIPKPATFGRLGADPLVPSRTTPTRRPRADMELPPTYDESVKAAPKAATPMTTTTTPNDSPYAFLTQFDTIFVVDDSGSMCGRGWRETAAALSAITPTCTAHDADGIDIFFLNHRNRRTNSGLAPGGYTNVNSTSKVQEIFNSVRPMGGTPTGTRLNQILKPYLASLEENMKRPNAIAIKPINIIVITDGVPSDDVESVIVAAARKLDNLEAEPWQVGIQFFQVGEEPEAADDLRDLDDALSSQHQVRDIVDTVPWNGQTGRALSADRLLKIVLGSVNRRLDRRRVSGDGQRA